MLVGRSLNIQILPADVVDRLIVNKEGAVGVLDGAVGGEDGIVGLHDGGGDPGSGIHGEFQL